MKIKPGILGGVFFLSASLFFAGCSSSQVKQQKYAKLSNSKEFEEEYDDVWNAAKEALSQYKVEEAKKEDGQIKTDWIYSTSTDKYLEYKVNGFPRKKYLQNRFKLNVTLRKQLGSVRVEVDIEEQIEELSDLGEFKDWEDSKEKDLSKAYEIIENINLKLNSRFKPS